MRCIECGSTNFDTDLFCLDCGRCYVEGDVIYLPRCPDCMEFLDGSPCACHREVDEQHDPQGEWALSPERLELLTHETNWEFYEDLWASLHPDTGDPEDFCVFKEFSPEEVYNLCNPTDEDMDYEENQNRDGSSPLTLSKGDTKQTTYPGGDPVRIQARYLSSGQWLSVAHGLGDGQPVFREGYVVSSDEHQVVIQFFSDMTPTAFRPDDMLLIEWAD